MAKSVAQVWAVGFDDGYPYTLESTLLDGDLRQVGYADRTPELKTARGLFNNGEMRAGRALLPDNMPKSFKWGGAAARMPDIIHTFGVVLVGDQVKAIIESFEPGVHQFFPLESRARGNVPARQMYILNVCNRLDSVDRTKTTKPFLRDRAWGISEPGELVFNLAQIGERKIWQDRHVYDSTYFTDDLKSAFEAASVSGVRYFGYRAE